MQSKGQASFELVLIAAVIVMAAVAIIGVMFPLDETIAFTITKSLALKELNKQDYLFTIERISSSNVSADGITLSVCVLPGISVAELDESLIDSDRIEREIKAKTRFKGETDIVEVEFLQGCI
ncbi:MAG: hypothetical protein ABH821_04265 [archaeon]